MPAVLAFFAGLSEEAVAVLFLVAVLAGVFIVRPLLVNLAQQLPVVGPALASRVDSVLNGWQTAIQAQASASVGAFSGTVDWLQASWAQLAQTVVGFAELTQTALFRIENQIIPAAAGAALAQATALVIDEASHAEALAAELRAGTAGALTLAEHDAAQLFGQATGYAYTVGLEAERQAAGLFAKAEGDAAALVASERDALLGELGKVGARAEALFTQSVAIGAAAEAALGAQLGEQAGKLARDLSAGVSALEQEIAKARVELGAAAATSVGVVAAEVAAIRALRCLKFCNELASLGDVLSIVDVAALVALVEFSLHDPGGLTRAWMGGVQPMLTATAAEIRSELGV